MSDTRQPERRPVEREDAVLPDEAPLLDDAETIGNVEEVETPGELIEERVERQERHDPALPDRAFDRIAPGV